MMRSILIVNLANWVHTLDAFFVRLFHDIYESLIRPKTYKEIMACMDKQDEDFCMVGT